MARTLITAVVKLNDKSHMNVFLKNCFFYSLIAYLNTLCGRHSEVEATGRTDFNALSDFISIQKLQADERENRKGERSGGRG